MNKFTIQKSFAISAGAGSGKTYTLSRRYINALVGFDYFREDYNTQESFVEELKTAKVSEIVTITYTEAAALEMKGRIFELVKKILYVESLNSKDSNYKSIVEANSHITSEQQEYVKKVLVKAYTDSGNSKISTIHAYCLDIIKANADIARIDTQLNIIKEDEKQSELSQIIFELFNEPENEATILDISSNISVFFLNNLIAKYVSNSKFRKDYDSFSRESIDVETYKKIIMELYPLPDVEDDIEYVKSYIYENKLENSQKYCDFLDAYASGFYDFEAKSWSTLSSEYEISIAFNKKPFNKHKEIKSSIDAIKSFESFIGVYQTIDMQKEDLFFEKIEKIKTLLHKIKANYDARLTELGKIDFDTIITRTLEIIPRSKKNYKYIMVDEFQDTNEIQFEIVKNSLNKDTNLFVVGDSKQSIYAFQGAEIEVFNNAVEDRTLFSSIEDMSKNHRSDGVVLDNVNKIFDNLLQKNEHLQLISQNYEAHPQDLEVFKEERKEQGSFKFLITSKAYQEEKDELDTIVAFISEIAEGEREEYHHISKLISEKQKAIAILFDSSTKMLLLKQKLREKGITAKVSASDNFYHTKEINDIYNTLQAIYILSNKELKDLSDAQRFYAVAAMRSSILKIDENSIKKYLDSNTLPSKLRIYIEQYKRLPLSELVKYIYENSNLLGVYAHFEDLEQRAANLYKFLHLCMEYQNTNESSLYRFLKLLENAIYFSESKEDEAFFKSDNTKSIEICSIHSTKGLAYPMVLLANSDKGLYSQITSDSLKHNNFTLSGDKKKIVGFKINAYEPLSLRVLKEVDKLKHLAEKKRLLYVALTRAEHDVIISAQLSQNKDGNISLREDTYLKMMIDALHVSKEELFEQIHNNCLHVKVISDDVNNRALHVEYVEHNIKPIIFEAKEIITATSGSETYDETAAKLGTITHKIFELYWDKLETTALEQICKKFDIDTEDEKRQIEKSIEKFIKSDLHVKLKNGAEHKFELEFHTQEKRGFIDLVYFDQEKDGWVIVDFKTGTASKEKEQGYQKQLEFYTDVLKEQGMEVIDRELLWV